jgi:hypothetical protein
VVAEKVASGPPQAVPLVKRPEVLGFSVDDEGRAVIRLHAALPIEEGAALLRLLLDAGFVMARREREP